MEATAKPTDTQILVLVSPDPRCAMSRVATHCESVFKLVGYEHVAIRSVDSQMVTELELAMEDDGITCDDMPPERITLITRAHTWLMHTVRQGRCEFLAENLSMEIDSIKTSQAYVVHGVYSDQEIEDLKAMAENLANTTLTVVEVPVSNAYYPADTCPIPPFKCAVSRTYITESIYFNGQADEFRLQSEVQACINRVRQPK